MTSKELDVNIKQLDIESIIKNSELCRYGMYLSSKLDTDTYLIGINSDKFHGKSMKHCYIVVEFDLRTGTKECLIETIMCEFIKQSTTAMLFYQEHIEQEIEQHLEDGELK